MAQVGVVANVPDARIIKGTSDLRRIVWGVVVHNQDFQVGIGLAEDGINAFRKQVSKFVTGNDKTNGGILHASYSFKIQSPAWVLSARSYQ